MGEGSGLLFSSKNMLWSVFQTKNFLLNLNSSLTPDLKEILWDLSTTSSLLLFSACKNLPHFLHRFQLGRVGTGCAFSEQHMLRMPKRYMNSSRAKEYLSETFLLFLIQNLSMLNVSSSLHL